MNRSLLIFFLLVSFSTAVLAQVAPAIQASNISFSTTTSNNTTISWTNGNGASQLVFVSLATAGTALPVNLTTYVANSSFGAGSQIGTTGWYCVYNGSTANTVTVSGLTPNSVYRTMVLSYNGGPGAEQYLTSASTANPANVATSAPTSITSFSPVVGAIGSSVVISGVNFDPTPSNNIVFFGAVKANVTAATSTSLTVTVPVSASYGSITVLNGLTKSIAVSNKFFSVTRNANNQLKGSDFDPSVNMYDNGMATYLAVSDLNDDGKPDLVVLNSNSGLLLIYKNTASTGQINSNSLSYTKAFNTGVAPKELAIGDMDNDGRTDIAVLNNNSISLFKNTSTSAISFSQSTLSTIQNPTSLAMGDADADGRLDLAVCSNSSPYLVVYRNITASQSSGILDGNSFIGKTITCNVPLENIVLGDLNDDGKADLVGGISYGNSNIALFKNNSQPGIISFDQIQSLSSGQYSTGNRSLLGDLDGDGKLDIVVAESSDTYIYIFRNISTTSLINFSGFINLNSGIYLSKHALADVSGDGKADILGTSIYSGELKFFQNSSTSGSVSFASSFGIDGGSGDNLVIADLDGDGKSDLVLSNSENGQTYLIRNHPITTPGTQASNVTFSSTLARSTKLSWTNGDGDSRAVFVSAGTTGTPAPVDGVVYTAGKFGAGSQIGNSGWFCVYSGYENSAVVTGLSVGTNYRMMVVENSGTSSPLYLKTAASGNPANIITSLDAPPVITSFSPASGPAGTTVTITGTNFNTTATNNSVYFGNVAAQVVAATTTSLTVTAPAGATYQPISVINTTTHLSGQASTGFISTFSPRKDRFSGDDFSTSYDFTIPGTAQKSSYNDIDGDGKADLIVCTSTNLYIYKNTATSGRIDANSFAAVPIAVAMANNKSFFVLSDLDGDGKLDIAMSNYQTASISVLKNSSGNGQISFESALIVPLNSGVQASSIAAGDLDGDGKQDLVIGNDNQNDDAIAVLMNTMGAGLFTSNSFAPSFLLRTEYITRPDRVKIADLNNDGKPDIIASSNSLYNRAIIVFSNKANSGLLNSDSFLAGNSGIDEVISDLALVDADNDGKLDLLTSLSSYNRIQIYKNNTLTGADFNSASFGSPLVINAPGIAGQSNITPADLDGDGKIDFLYTNQTSNIYTYRNTSSTTISFVNDGAIPVANIPQGLEIADVDADGKADISYYLGSAAVSFLRNSPLFGPVTQASAISFSATSSSKTTLNWTNGSGAKRVVFAKEGNTGMPAPLNNTLYSAGAMGSGTQIASTGWYCVYNGTANTATVTGLKELTDYQFMVVEYNGSAAAEQYLTSTSTGNPAVLSTPVTLAPTVQASNISATAGYLSSTLNWTNGNGDGRAVFMFKGVSGSPVPVNTSTYTANPAFGSGTQIGSSGWYCVYNGTGSTVNVTGLTIASAYQIMVVEYNGIASQEQYLLSTASANPYNFSTLIVPSITSFSPLSGVAGSTVTITGTGFNTSPANNLVFFGGAKAIVNTASSTSLTVTVPVGALHKPITVTNTDNQLTGASSLLFLPSYPGKGTLAASDFSAPIALPTGTATSPASYGVAMGDLNGDGKLDVVVSNNAATGSGISIFKNTAVAGTLSTGNFAKQDISTVTVSPKQVAVQDLNGDGKPEILLIYSTAKLSIYPNTSTGEGSISMGTPIELSTGNTPNGIAVGDIDGDGKLDIAVVNTGSNSISLFKNTTSGSGLSFNSAVSYLTPTSPQSVDIKDMNGDKKPDIVVSSVTTTYISFFKNNATIGAPFTSATFATRLDLITSVAAPVALAIGDLDNDGRNDVVAGAQSSLYYGIIRNLVSTTGSTFSTGTFQTTVRPPTTTGYITNCLALGDLDGDGKLDILTGSSTGTTNNIGLIKNTTTAGNFSLSSVATLVALPVSAQISAIAVGDLDGDGKPDIALANRASDNGLVLFRNDPALAPTTQASALTASQVKANTATLSWTNGDGNKRAVFVKPTQSGNAQPDDLKSYTPNTAVGTGAQIGQTGWYCVYNGTGTTVDITGLKSLQDYSAMVIEYNEYATYPYYKTGTGTGNPGTFSTPASSIATLSDLTLSVGTLSPVFDAATTTYSASVANTVSSITLSPIKTDSTASLKINSKTAASPVALSPGLNQIVIEVTAQDGIAKKTYTLAVTRVANAPTNITLSATSINENVPANSTIGTFSAMDAEGGLMSYALAAGTGDSDNAVFSISGDSLKIKASPNYETKASYAIRVSVTDPDGLTFEKAFVISINDLPESPVITVTGTPETLSGTYGTASASTTFLVAGTDLNEAILISPPNGFELSLNNTTFSGSLSLGSSGTLASTMVYLRLKNTIAAGNAYNGNIVLTSSGASTVTIATATSSVAKASQLITFNTLAGKTYGDADFSLSASGGASGNALSYHSSNTAVATVSGSTVTIVGAGTTTITASQAGNANYNPASDVAQVLTVGKKSASISLSNLFQTYDGTAKAVTVTTNPDNLTGLTVTYNGSTNLPVNIGSYAVVASLNNANYSATNASAVLQIESVLAVNLSRFSVKAENNSARIEWQTSNELPQVIFELERSADGVNFEKLGSIPGTETNASKQTYQMYDYSPINGRSYYRLKQVEHDGKISYFDIQTLLFKFEAPVSVSAYPIPMIDRQLNIIFENYQGQQVKADLVEMGGKLINSEIINLGAASNIYPIHLNSKPAAGQYILYLKGNDLNRAIKITVQ